MRQDRPIILASASPRRAELLASAGIQCVVVPSGIAEDLRLGEAPADHVLRLARAKARDVAETFVGRFFLGADTVVVLGGEVLGKPRDDADAEGMLRRLSGCTHEVMTGYEVYDKEGMRGYGEVVTTRVEFKPLSPQEIRAYVATGGPRDKAGAYAIQGHAAYMVRRVEGSYTNVVGLPLCEVVEALRRVGAVSVT
jgi:nucleoside triphosphate pyrophosphatase